MSNRYDLRLSHVRTFLVAAKHNSFREAAKRLDLTVATVNNHIAALELLASDFLREELEE